MPLITTIQQIIDNGVKVNAVNDDSSIADIQAAEDMFIEPILGSALYTDLVAHPGDAKYVDLLPKVKRALAPLAYWLDLPNIHTQITDRGVTTAESNNMQAAHWWEFESRRESLAVKGCFALDKLLQWLSVPENAEAVVWTIPNKFNLIIKTGVEFDCFFPLYQPYRVFESLRPVLRLIEDKYLRTTIGDTFFEELRDTNLPEDKTSWSANQVKINEAIKLLKKAATHLTIAKSVDILPVRVSTEGFTVSLKDISDKSRSQNVPAPDAQIYNLQTSAQRDGETYLLELSDYLNNNASSTLFTTYKNSSYYTAPTAADNSDPNSTQNIFVL